jgi:hypothetical protein
MSFRHEHAHTTTSERNIMNTSPSPLALLSPRKPGVKKHFSSSILLWMRTDQPRQTGMDHWRGPHSGIISATPGLEEYRQIHLAAENPGRWPATDGIETTIPVDRKVDGVAEVTLRSILSPLQGRKQSQLAFVDEVNVFRRTLLYSGLPTWSRWYDVAPPGATVGARSLVYLRRRDGVGAGEFRNLVNKQLVPALAGAGVLRELRTQTFLPWNKRLWDTPHVAHDNPHDQRFHASLILGFTDTAARDSYYAGSVIEELSRQVTPLASAIHAYDVTATLTYVKDGEILSHYQE